MQNEPNQPIVQQNESHTEPLRKLFIFAAEDLYASLTCFRVILDRAANVPEIEQTEAHKVMINIRSKAQDAMLDLTAALKQHSVFIQRTMAEISGTIKPTGNGG